jgi:hypothetical protein
MDADEVVVGTVVRYPRTGTTGKVVRVEEIEGQVYAELDSTQLYYRVDQLVSTERPMGGEREEKGSVQEYLEKETEFARQLEDAWFTTDQSCEGGG